MDIEISPKELAKALGKLGGRANVDKYGTEHMKRISKLAVEAKRAKRENQK